MFVCSKPKARCWRSIINRLIRSSSFDVRKMIFEFVTMFDKMVFDPSLKAGVGNDWLLLVIHTVILKSKYDLLIWECTNKTLSLLSFET